MRLFVSLRSTRFPIDEPFVFARVFASAYCGLNGETVRGAINWLDRAGVIYREGQHRRAILWEAPSPRPIRPRSSSPGKTMTRTNRPPTPALALNIEESCAALGVSWDTWKKEIEPEVRLVRQGTRKLVPVKELERWLEEHADLTVPRR